MLEEAIYWMIFWSVAFAAIFIGHTIRKILIKKGIIEIDAGKTEEDEN